MNIPIFTAVQYVDKAGNLTPQMQIYNDELNQALQNGLSDNGWTLPLVTADQLASITPGNIAANMPNGTMWYDTTNNEFVVKINGTLVKVTTASYP